MADTSQYNIHSICRICLEYLDSDVYDLFTIPGLSKKLQLCTSLTVEPQDGFPKNLCAVCYTRLNELHDFQKQCVESVQKLQEMISNNAFLSGHTFDMLETGTEMVSENNGVMVAPDEDDRLNFDPLLNHKMELIEEEDVFKMLEHVEKDMEEAPLVEPEITQEQDDIIDTESSSESDDDGDLDFEVDKKSEKSNESDDDLPLVLRLRKAKEGDAFKVKPGPKPKRKRIPAKERHLHTIIDCHICHQKFKKVARYQEHMKHHNDKLQHQCTFPSCQKGFTTANALRVHVEHAHTEVVANFPCPEEGCGRAFVKTGLLKWHLKKVHNIIQDQNEPKTYSCTECEKVFRCPMALKKHMYKHDGKELPFPCNICDKRFITASALKDHLMRHAGIKNFVCPYCGVGKTTRQELNIHINTHTREKKFQCPHCSHCSHNKQNLRKHVKIVHDKIKDFACQYCGKAFGKSDACRMHEMTHTGEKRFECNLCGKQFLYNRNLTKHLQTHEKKELRPVKIKKKKGVQEGIGGPQLSEMSELADQGSDWKEDHVKAAEEILKVCAQSTRLVPILPHPRRVERVDISQLAGTAVNPIPSVSVPSWSAQSQYNMLKEGPFTCPECGQGFNFQGNLKKHYRIVHEKVRDFACRFCEKRFAKAETLKHHEMTHTGEKPYTCVHCGKAFIQNHTLKRHLKVHLKKPKETPPNTVEEIKIPKSETKSEEECAAIIEAAKDQLESMKVQSTDTTGA